MTAHIPIILITDKADTEYKLQAFREQADDFLLKPFDIHELDIRMKNLILLRKRLQKYYQHNDVVLADQSCEQQTFIKFSNKTRSKDICFVQKFEEVLESHYDKLGFNVGKMAELLCITKRQLHRKTSAIIGESPSNLLRLYRIYKARFLLEKGQSITETAFDVGYSHASYFSSAFKAFYGITPKQYRSMYV